MHRTLPALALLLACAAAPVRAQLSGTVTDARGAPLAGAVVELWSGERRVAARATDDAGRFAFGAQEARGGSGLLARHPGQRPARISVSPPASGVELRLETEPVALRAVTARAAPRRPCPNVESPEARALWTASAARYSRALDTLPVGSRFAWDERTVASERELGAVAAGSLRRGAGMGSPAVRRSWFAAVERAGYAYRVAGESGAREFGAWHFPLPFMGAHLVSDAFGRLHTLGIVERDGAQVVVGFCPRPGALAGKPRVHGTLRISLRDSLLAEARYEFRTPSDDEHAGAEIVYAPASAPDGRPLPVLSTELFWRRPAGARGLYQLYREYEGWEVGRVSPAVPPGWTRPAGAAPPATPR